MQGLLLWTCHARCRAIVCRAGLVVVLLGVGLTLILSTSQV